ncbi:unnamed protein product [Protopolystoma xenopodis]|uniref:Uncharacterized protein n=1 Tax=Protopolystoma xenopodis TaxID=117903 RepID=A0A3S5APF3_9PLAT|nr:unnamed protein product [Protopolystoma xenopodis]
MRPPPNPAPSAPLAEAAASPPNLDPATPPPPSELWIPRAAGPAVWFPNASEALSPPRLASDLSGAAANAVSTPTTNNTNMTVSSSSPSAASGPHLLDCAALVMLSLLLTIAKLACVG